MNDYLKILYKILKVDENKIYYDRRIFKEINKFNKKNLFVRTLTISNRVLFESSLAIKYLTFGRLSAMF